MAIIIRLHPKEICGYFLCMTMLAAIFIGIIEIGPKPYLPTPDTEAPPTNSTAPRQRCTPRTNYPGPALLKMDTIYETEMESALRLAKQTWPLQNCYFNCVDRESLTLGLYCR